MLITESIRSAALAIIFAVALGGCAEPQRLDYNKALEQFSQGAFDAARQQFASLAKNGYPPAQFHLGLLYQNGLGVKRNLREAVYWYEKAAQQENVAAQYTLAQQYARGEGVPQSAVLALRWLERLAQRGFTHAEFQVGLLYAGGVGTPQDADKALYWLQRAANKQHTLAIERLVQVYEQGLLGQAKDPQQAQYWQAQSQPKFF